MTYGSRFAARRDAGSEEAAAGLGWGLLVGAMSYYAEFVRRFGSRRALAVVAAIAAVAAVTGVWLVPGLVSNEQADLAALKRSEDEMLAASDLRSRFVRLSSRHSNKCGLRPESLSTIAVNGRLQGSCCRRMDLHKYTEQIAGLRRYAHVPEVPSDPYDIPVSLAKRLLGYQKSIELTTAQQATYDRAMQLSEEHGPCCCRCWRWTTFEGQAKFLIARREFDTEAIAEIWDLEDGCGGSSHIGHPGSA